VAVIPLLETTGGGLAGWTGERGAASIFAEEGLHSSTACAGGGAGAGDIGRPAGATSGAAISTVREASPAAEACMAAGVSSMAGAFTPLSAVGSSGWLSLGGAFFATRFGGFFTVPALEAFVALARGFTVRFLAGFFVSPGCSATKG